MNEFDKDQINPNQPPITPETNSWQSNPPAPENGGYSYRGDQLTDATTRVNQPSTDPFNAYSGFGAAPNSFAQAPNHTPPYQNIGNTPSGEYEVSFDSASGKYTYTDHSTSPKSEKPKKERKSHRGLLALGLCATILVSALLGVFGGSFAAMYWFDKTNINEQNLNNTVQQSTVVKVNDGEVNYGAIADAAAECYDSVVVIETYLSQSLAEAGEPSGAGSGVIWTENGYIVTCNHVISGANVIRVIFTDGNAYYADIVGQDEQTDLAVLKIQATGLKAITARNSSLVLGETAIAIGNPLGVLANSVSEGILSCLAREITVEGQTMSLLQTTAAVNSGNSGGGLFDINGSLIGIVNAKSTGDSVEGLGFAIPIETVMMISTQLIEQGFVSGRPQLGITVVTVNQSNASAVFSNPDYADLEEYATKPSNDPWGRTQLVPGTYIVDASNVVGYSEGSDSLKFGDQVLYVGSKQINANEDIKAALHGYQAGDTIQLTVLRDQSQTIIINVLLGEQGQK